MDMNIIVQKFGGTSVSKEESRSHCLQHVMSELGEGNKVIVVISAMGRKGDPYATDTLLSLLGENVHHLSKKDLDLFLSTGELISSSVFSNLLHEHKISNTILTGGQAGIITNEDYTNAKITDLQPEKLLEALKTYDVVVVPGFQGMTTEGNITTLGRGGSDTTATAIGVGVNAKFVDIFTDVEGIMTADPRIVSNAKILDIATYNEISNLAHLGAKVVHPRAVEIAMQKNIPVRVRSTFSNTEGTLITNITEINSDNDLRTVTGITQTAELIQVSVRKERFQNIFEILSANDISIDFIQTTVDSISFTLPKHAKTFALSLLTSHDFEVNIIDDVAKVSIVGAGIHGVPGVMSKAINALYLNEIDVFQSADSHTTIWFLVPQNKMNDAVRALHDAFIY